MMHPEMYCLSLPRGALSPTHVVGSGAVLRVAWRRRTCTSSSYCRRGYPDSGYRPSPSQPPHRALLRSDSFGWPPMYAAIAPAPVCLPPCPATLPSPLAHGAAALVTASLHFPIVRSPADYAFSLLAEPPPPSQRSMSATTQVNVLARPPPTSTLPSSAPLQTTLHFMNQTVPKSSLRSSSEHKDQTRAVAAYGSAGA
jgi:hypothetical protein